MTKRTKLTLAAGAAAATVVAGLGAAGAVAASRALSPGDEQKAVIDDVASQLGVEPEALSNAFKKAYEHRIDAAVAAGRLTKEQGAELKKRLDASTFPLPLLGEVPPDGPFGHRFGFGLAHDDHFGILDAAASYLGMSEDELRTALDGKTLSHVAKDHGKTVSGLVAALVAAEEKRIDQAVKDGRLTQDQANALESGIQDRVQALVNGGLPALRHFGGPSGFRPWPGSPRAPPALFGPPA